MCLLMFLILITGCNIKYELNIDSASENIDVTNMEVFPENELNYTPIGLFFQGYTYNTSQIDDDKYKASMQFGNLENLMENSILFSKLEMDKFISIDDKTVSINFQISDEIKRYIELYGHPNNIEFSLYIPYHVMSNNATRVSKNTYTWIINDLEKDTINISFDMSKTPNQKNKLMDIYIIVGLSAIILVVIIYLVIRNKKANEI